MTPLEANDISTFDATVLHADRPVVVDFWAPWCGPCRLVAPELDALAAAHGDRLHVVKVNVDANPTVALRYGIQGIPTIGLFRGGKLVATSVGAKPRRAIEADLGIAAAV
ncbi:MAG: thioredoxin [Acidimicrobiales bacterium]